MVLTVLIAGLDTAHQVELFQLVRVSQLHMEEGRRVLNLGLFRDQTKPVLLVQVYHQVFQDGLKLGLVVAEYPVIIHVTNMLQSIIRLTTLRHPAVERNARDLPQLAPQTLCFLM